MAQEYNKRYSIKIARNVMELYSKCKYVRKLSTLNIRHLANMLAWKVMHSLFPSKPHYVMILLILLAQIDGEHKSEQGS
jgi:hypothetical protein